MSRGPEKKVKKEIKKGLLKLWPSGVHLMVVPGGFGMGGIPDHMFCAPVVITPEMVGKTYGMFIVIEAKADKKVPTGLQFIKLAEFTRAGAFATFTAGLAQVPQLIANLKEKFCLK